jgi:hypothetical protein
MKSFGKSDTLQVVSELAVVHGEIFREFFLTAEERFVA